MPDEVLTFEEYRARAAELWEEERQNEIDAVARRLEGADRSRLQSRENSKRQAEAARREFEAECATATEAHRALYGDLAGQLDPAKSYDILRINNVPHLAGALAFSSSEKAAACREHLRGGVLYADPEGGARSIPGRHLGQWVHQGELLAVDPSPADLAALASEVEAAKRERLRQEAEVAKREREQGEAERRRKKYGAPVGG